MTCGNVTTIRGSLPRYAHSDDDCNDTADPINILFLNEKASDLEDTLHGITNTHKNKKWKTPSWFFVTTARDQWVRIDNQCREQDKQCVVGWIWDRFHIRLWDLPNGNVIANAHLEALLSVGGNLPLPRPHRPTSFDSGMDAVCEDFQAQGRQVTREALPMNNYVNDPHCEGKAAVIG